MIIQELESWLNKRCNGDWEHQGGISIESTDNPGWYVKVDFNGLEHLIDSSVVEHNIVRSDLDFVIFKYDSRLDFLGIACGIFNLTEALEIFIRLDI